MKRTKDILPEGRETFSPKEVAAYLREAEPSLNDSTILRWCQRGKIEAVKPMGRWSVPRHALAKLLVAFGIAVMGMVHGNHSHAGYMVDTRKHYHCRMVDHAREHGWNNNHS